MSAALPLTCVIVDDNEINRLTLEHLVDLTPELTLVASLPGGVEALHFFRQGGQCDLLLLDVEMPNLSGLELVKLLPAPAPAVVLVTTHRSFAVAAFELQAVDYLVKPVEFSRFSQAVARVLATRPAPAASAPAPAPAPAKADTKTELFVKVGTRTIRVNFDDVLYIEALSTYSVLVTPTHKHIVYLTLKSLAERLPFDHFLRVHRSYIVNMQRIEAVEDYMLKLGPYEVPVGKSYQEEFLKNLRSL
jgi:two-component system LytT family response regulator